MKEILEICEQNDIILLEDSCESMGSFYNDTKTGSFGLMSSFSFFYGHHMSTIEGGMVCTDDYELYNILKSIRAHGWNRDLDESFKSKLKENLDVDEFKKKVRSGAFPFGTIVIESEEKFDKEMADVIYYLNVLALNRGKTLNDYAEISYQKVMSKKNK